MPAKTDYLSTYLQDHRAGAELGRTLAERMRDENAGTPYEDFLRQLAQEIDDDVATLEAIMDRLDIDASALKTAGAKVAEKLGRLKPNEHLASYSPLSRVQELEALRGGVQGKQALWDALYEISTEDERLTPAELEGLIAKAERQLSGLRVHHRMASREAFGG